MTIGFLDSSYVIALHSTRDQNRRRAEVHWKSAKAPMPLVTTSYVLDEIVTHLNSHNCHDRAVEVGLHLQRSASVELIHVDRPLFDSAWDYFVRHADKRYSLTDCISFVVMQRRGLRQALTFDQHFQQAGFECLPAMGSASS